MDLCRGIPTLCCPGKLPGRPGKDVPVQAEIPQGEPTLSDAEEDADPAGSSVVAETVPTSSAASTDQEPSEGAARREAQLAPAIRLHGDPNRGRGESSKWNA